MGADSGAPTRPPGGACSHCPHVWTWLWTVVRRAKAFVLVDQAGPLWTACADVLREQVSEAVWLTTFSAVEAVTVQDGSLVLAVPSTVVKERIEQRYRTLVEGALVAGHLVDTKKQKTIIVLKKERRQHYKRRNGHRQLLSTVRITEILTGGAKLTTQPDERIKARYAAANASTASAATSEAEPKAKPAAKSKAKTAAPAEAPAAEAAPAAKPARAAKPKAAKAETEAKPARTAKAKADDTAAEKPAKKPAAKKAPKADKE